MKKFLNFMCLLMVFSLTMMLTSCGLGNTNNGNQTNNTTNGTDNNNQNDTILNEYILYSDNNIAENDAVKIEIESSCWGNDNYSLTVRVKVTNKEYTTNTYKFKNINLIKESTGATYTVGTMFASPNLKIDAELTQSLSLSSTIPTSIKDEKYKISFEINKYKITYYLYEMPDELRVNRKVTYYINDYLNNTQVYADTVKDKRKLSSLYTYESSDNQYYCNTWYTDSNFKIKFNISTSITEDTSLYGRAVSNIKWTTLSTDVYSFVNGINHVPSNGVLVIPSTYLNKELCIGLYAIQGVNLNKIYIPKTVHIIYNGNFTNIGNATIYYEETEAEWKALFYMASDIYTKNVVYNTKYNG